ncbi:MAG: bacterio-opsin activator domain-containing protein [Halovenus sp.]|uniref:bacterio-opsin activator domain-containing protein n=1 Tax=Halovenus amylolytica TaxID=2500550 RepID=UPI000FE3FC3E
MGNERVLVVDDSSTAEEAVSTLEDAGCRVSVDRSAADALVSLRSERIDAVVTEFSLPDDDGVELLREIKSLYDAVPVVMYTASGDERTASLAIDAGVAAYIPKRDPEGASRLVETIEEVVSGRQLGIDRDDLPEPTAETIVRAVDEAPVGITLSDPSLPDNPITYLNEAYEQLTGYSAEEVIGRNCRFLQGPDTEEEPVAQMRKAIDADEPVSVELLNYREDGTPFWNQVTIAPVYDDQGEVSHYVGFQNDVTERKEAEALAKQRADALREERQGLERVLGRVSGLVNEVSHALVNASDREEIEESVCTEIAAASDYTHAWIGEMRAGGSGISIRVQDGPQQQSIETGAGTEWSDTVFERAIEEGAVKIVSEADELPPPVTPERFDATTMAIVPLTYRRVTYGVLAVYAEGSDVLDHRETEVFGAVGQMIASGINAVETKQVLTADRVTELGFEITDDSFPLIQLAKAAEGSISYNGSTISDGRSLRMFVTMTEPPEDFDALIANCPDIRNGFVVANQDGKVAASIELDGAAAFQELAEYGATVRDLSASGSSGTAQLHIDLPVEGDVRSVLSVLESAYDGVNLVRQRERERDPRPTAEFVATVADRLTDRQYTALETAYLSNYFDFPRPVSGEELAESMDISRQTYHQHLRAAQRKLLEEFFETD